MADKARYSKPASQVDLEERQKSKNESSLRLVRASDAPLSDNGYVGVDTVYQNAANDTERPRQAKGPEAKVFSEFLADDAEYPALDADADDDEEEDAQTPNTPPPTGTTTPATGGGGGSSSGSNQ